VVPVNFSSLGAARRSDLGGAGRFSLADRSHKFWSSPGAQMIRAAVASSVAAVVRSLIRPVRQDEPVDHYFADFAKATPIASVVFTQVCFLNPSHEDQLSDGGSTCFSPNLKSFPSVHGVQP